MLVSINNESSNTILYRDNDSNNEFCSLTDKIFQSSHESDVLRSTGGNLASNDTTRERNLLKSATSLSFRFPWRNTNETAEINLRETCLRKRRESKKGERTISSSI